jgi:hypothetical protein
MAVSSRYPVGHLRGGYGTNPILAKLGLDDPTEARLALLLCTYCLVSDRRTAALNWEGVVPSHVRKAR